jgi:hypothetical protein
MDARNPYAPSQASLRIGVPSRNADGQVTAWRDKRVMVMIRDAAIPHRCVKCNEPAEDETKTRTLYWHSPWLYLLLLVNILIFLIVALIVRKKASVSAGLCSEHKARRRNALMAAWIGLLAGLLLLYAGFSTSLGGWGALTGVFVMLTAIVAGSVMSRIVYAVRIDKDYVRLKGCGEPFLETLPEFPR